MQADIERSRKRKNVVIGVVMILLLVVAPVGYSLFSGDGGGSGDGNEVTEMGVDFVRDGGLWKTEFDGSVFGFQYLPSEVVNVSVSGVYDFEDYVNEVLYFVDADDGASEVLNNLGAYILRYQPACLQQAGSGQQIVGSGVCEGDLPMKGCDSNLIIFEDGAETMVWKDGGCVYIVGDGVRGADAFLYKALGLSSTSGNG